MTGPSHFAVAAPIALVGGSGIVLAILILFTLGVIYGLYTRRGSGINPRPYERSYGDAPGARGEGSVSGRDDRVSTRNWSRGTR